MSIFNSILSQIGRASSWLSREDYLKGIKPAQISELAKGLEAKFKTLQQDFIDRMESSDALPFGSTSPNSTCIQGKEDFARIDGLVRWNNRSSNLCYFQEMGEKFEGICRAANGKMSTKTLSEAALLKVEDKVCDTSEQDSLPFK